jgi:hypothetical protein
MPPMTIPDCSFGPSVAQPGNASVAVSAATNNAFLFIVTPPWKNGVGILSLIMRCSNAPCHSREVSREIREGALTGVKVPSGPRLEFGLNPFRRSGPERSAR